MHIAMQKVCAGPLSFSLANHDPDDITLLSRSPDMSACALSQVHSADAVVRRSIARSYSRGLLGPQCCPACAVCWQLLDEEAEHGFAFGVKW